MNKSAQQFVHKHDGEQPIIQQQVCNDLLAQLGNTQGLWLDVGCGPNIQPLGDHSIGIDLAHFHGGNRMQACTEAIPLANASVDGIFSNMALQWCEQPLTAIEEWARVCKPGARIACSITCAGNFSELIKAYYQLGLPCPVQPTLPATAWVSLFATRFSIIQHHTHHFELAFDHIRQLTQHMQETGANATPKGSLLPTSTVLDRLQALYPKADKDKLVLTYRIVSLTAVKPFE